MQKNVTVEGLVTSVNENLLLFEVNSITVHLSLYFADNPNGTIPLQSMQVKVSSSYYLSDKNGIHSIILVPGDYTKVEDIEVPLMPSHAFLNHILQSNYTLDDALQFAEAYYELKKQFDYVNTDDLIFKVVTKIKNFKLLFLKNVKLSTKCSDFYEDFSYYTFCNYWNWSHSNERQHLIGYLFIDKKIGTLFFSDTQSKIPCVLLNQEKKDLVDFLHCFILVRDYVFIEEIYNCGDFRIIEYLLIDVKNIIDLGLKQDEKRVFPVKDITELQEFKKATCKVLSKSMAMAASEFEVIAWLELLMDSTRLFLRLYNNFSPFLKVGFDYQLFYKTKAAAIFDKEVHSAESSTLQLRLIPGSFFYPIPTENIQDRIINSSEALNKLKSFDSNLVSFEGVIALKKFVNPLSSRTNRVSSNQSFGTPGTKTHILEFKTTTTSLVLYLNNWENLALPYGLIPNMRVKVYNVKPQKQKYYKSTILTSIEVINYEPTIKFESANLYLKYPKICFYFGAGHLIPDGTIIWSKIISLFVIGLKINNLNPTITLIVMDKMGESKLLAKGKNGLFLLRLLLGFSEHLFKKWCKGLENIDYSYAKSEGCQGNIANISGVHISLTKLLISLETKQMNLHIMARKMYNEGVDKSVFFFLDGVRY